MSPAQINILLWYHSRAEDYGDSLGKDYVKGQVAWFIDAGLIREGSDIEGKSYTLTPKGTFYVDALCNLPLPETQFIIPESPLP